MADDETLRGPLLRLAERGERPAIIAFADAAAERLTFAELGREVERLARGLLAAGTRGGEVVAIYAGNRPEWVIAALAVMVAGAVVVPLDIRLSKAALADEIRRSGCRRLFTTTDRLEDLQDALGDGSGLDLYLLDTREDRAEGRSWRSLPADDAQPLPALSADDDAALFFTSGTTGKPKGVPLTHRNLLSDLQGLLETDLISARERALLPLPLHHVYPFVVGMLAPLIGGAAIVLPAGISGPQIQHALREGGATAVIGIPKLLDALLAAIQRRVAKAGKLAARAFDGLLGLCVRLRRRFGWRIGGVLFAPLRRAVAPDLRLFAPGGAPLDPDTAWTLDTLGWDVLSGYGLTETSPIISFNTREHNRISTVGRPLPGVELRIDSPDEAGDGEILVRGPNVFAGYKDDPDATAKALSEDGWFRTGDLGAVGPDGYLSIRARVNETIVLPGGKKVFPEEVEALYLESPAIEEIAILEHGGKLAALVVADRGGLRAAGAADPNQAVGDALRQRAEDLPRHQRVSDFAVARQPLPRTTMRKLRRHLLPELYEQAKSGTGPAAPEELSEADRALLRAEAARRAWDWLKGRYPDKRIGMDADLQLDLGIDSLDWVSLTLDLQDEVGVRLGEDVLSRVSTVRDLLEEIVTVGERGGEAPPPGTLTPEQRRWLEPPGPLATALSVPLFALNRLIMQALFRLRVRGRERLPPGGPYILAPNHASFLDPFALAAALSLAQARQTYWAGFSAYLFEHAPQRLFSRIVHALPVDPARAPATSLTFGIEALKSGHVLVWFPEGARSPDGELQRFTPGIGRIVAETGAPVVPVHIAGSFEAWPRGRRWPRPRPVGVLFGEPLHPEQGEAATDAGETAEKFAARLRDRVAALAAEQDAAR